MAKSGAAAIKWSCFENLDRRYRISSVIRRSFFFPNNPKTLVPSYKTDLNYKTALDLWDCLGWVLQFYRTDLVVGRHFREGKTPCYS